MTEEELLKEFRNEFETQDCYEPSCELRDCCECRTFQEAYEDYREALGYMPRIMVGLDPNE